MNISISTLGLYPARIENVLDFVTDLNIKYLEVVHEYPYDKLTSDNFSTHDINLSIHAPMSDVNISSHVDKIRNTSVDIMEDSFKVANQWGVDRVVVHPGSIPVMALKYPEKILKYNKESLLKLQKSAEDYGVMMCVENMPMIDRMLYTNIDALFELVENELYSGITMDVGHAHNNGFSPEQMFASDYIHHVHLSDNDGSYDMHDALGTHNIDFNQIFRILKDKKYDDIAVIEVNTKQEVLKSVEYLKNINVL
ncbi:MAG: sugar phosphate isomerase/epimerase [Methanosphaera sp.]|nr:sugar phosphate isomerase/epimerase [Methanosphaera sp.]